MQEHLCEDCKKGQNLASVPSIRVQGIGQCARCGKYLWRDEEGLPGDGASPSPDYDRH
jgi:hypothetical protein